MQQNTELYTFLEINKQAKKAFKLRQVYNTLSTHDFVFELPCTHYDVSTCNDRRFADRGTNHMHVVDINPPEQTEEEEYKLAMELRLKCQQLCLNPSLGE